MNIIAILAWREAIFCRLGWAKQNPTHFFSKYLGRINLQWFLCI